MEVTTIQKFIHTSPRKLRLVADMVRKMEPNVAVDTLRVTPKVAALDLSKAIQTVLANAKQAGMDVNKVAFGKIEIDEAMKMRRFRAGTRGRVRPYKRRMAHIKIVLTDVLKPTTLSSKGKAQISNVKDETTQPAVKISKIEKDKENK